MSMKLSILYNNATTIVFKGSASNFVAFDGSVGDLVQILNCLIGFRLDHPYKYCAPTASNVHCTSNPSKELQANIL